MFVDHSPSRDTFLYIRVPGLGIDGQINFFFYSFILSLLVIPFFKVASVEMSLNGFDNLGSMMMMMDAGKWKLSEQRQ